MTSVKNRFIMRYILILVLFIVSIVLLSYGFIKKEYISVNYSEDNSINYKVYLNQNNYFNTPYLEENRTYIANLINYLDIDFHYNLKLSEKINGDYTYSVIAKVKANKANGEKGNYWTNDYVLVQPKKMNLTNKDVLSINENVKVDYNKYNDVLNSFKKEYGIVPEGLLDVVLNVESTGKGEVFTEPVDISSNLSLSIPLLEKAVEANISKNAKSNNNTITMIDRSYASYHKISGIAGLLLLLTSVLIFISTMLNKKKFNEENIFDVTLEKILSSHDSIIANVSTLPDISDMKLIEVTEFSELIDVYNEVRMPINYYNSKAGEEAIFIIVNDNMAWRFILDKNSLENHKDYSSDQSNEVSYKIENVNVNNENKENNENNETKLGFTNRFKFDIDNTLTNLKMARLKDSEDEKK